MSFNPYAAPEPGSDIEAPGAGPGGEPGPWDVGQVFNQSWAIFKIHWLMLSVVVLINQMAVGGASGVGGGIVAGLQLQPDTAEYWVVDISFRLLAQLIAIFLQIGMIRIFVSTAAPHYPTPELGQLFSGGDRFGPMLLTQLLVSLIVLVGFLLLIIPGIIAGLGLMYAPYLCVDKRLPPVEAMKESWRITTGSKLNIFVVGLVGIPIVLLGLLALCIGILPASALIALMYAVVYRHLTNQPTAPVVPHNG